MKKIIIAIDNQKIYDDLKKEKIIKIIGKNLIYKEAILEILEKDKKIDFIILYEKILGEINLLELIKKIKNINKKITIILILENNNEKLEKKLKKINIKNIYLKNNIDSKILINKILKKENNIKNEKIKNENEKKYHINLNIIKKITNKIRKVKYIKRYINDIKQKTNKKSKHNNKKVNKIIIILNSNKKDKTLISVSLAKKLKNQNQNVAIINANKYSKEVNKYEKDYYIKKEIEKFEEEIKKQEIKNLEKIKLNNIKNNKIKNINNKNNIKIKLKKDKNKKIYKNNLNKNQIIKKNNNKIKIKNKNKKIMKKIEKNKNNKIKKINKIQINRIIKIISKKIEKNIIYISNLNLILKILKKINSEIKKEEVLLEIINKIQKQYNYVIIEIDNIKNSNRYNKILEKADKIILMVENNYLGIKRNIQLKTRLERNYKISNESLYIIIIKNNKNNISNSIIKKIFEHIKIIGNINLKNKNDNNIKIILNKI